MALFLVIVFIVIPLFIDYALIQTCPYMWVPAIVFVLCSVLLLVVEWKKPSEPSFTFTPSKPEKIKNDKFTIEEDD